MAKLNAKARKKLPAKVFAGPKRTFPIPDKNHARLALSMSAGKPVAGRVRAAVKKKYPSIGKK